MNAIQQAIENADGDGLKRGAHSLKGSIGFLHCKSATGLAQELEITGGTGDLSPAKDTAARLDNALQALVTAMKQRFAID